MPYNLTQFFIRQPRVSSVNDSRTLPPYTQGTVTLLNAFTIQYTGSGSSCLMHLTAQKLTTLVNRDRSHADNLNISMSGKTLQELVNAINANPSYSAVLQGTGSDRAMIVGVTNQSILTVYQVTYGKKGEYLVEADVTGKLGSASVRWTKNLFSFSSTDFQWAINSGASPDQTGILVPLSGITPIDSGAEIVFVANPDNSIFDIASDKTKTNEFLVRNAGAGIQFVNMGVLPKIIPGTLEIVINDAPAIENVDYSISLTDNRINFLKGISGEIHPITESVSFVDTNVQGINGVILDSIQVTKDGVPLVLNVDYFPQQTTEYQGKQVGSGRVFFTKTLSEDPIAEYVLTTESSIYGDDLIIKKNGSPIPSDSYLIVYEAGFLNLNEPLFPDDVLTATYVSSELGEITDEIIAGTPASITSTVEGPFTIQTGINDELVIESDGIEETIYLPIGDEVILDDVVAQYNDQASFSIATKNTEGTKMVIASKTAGTSSTLLVKNASGNETMGFFASSTSTGEGSLGGEFAFTLANAPVVISSFSAPSGGDTFILKDFNLASNYPTNSLVAIQSDLYLIDSATTDPYATLYSSVKDTTYRISADINDTFIFTLDGSEYTITLTEGDRTALEICDDINLALISPIASVVTFNAGERIRLKSNTSGLLSQIKIGGGTSNDTLGFKNSEEDTGLLNTVVKIKGSFRMDYENPILRTTRRSVSFVSETSAHEKAPSGVSSLFFPVENLTGFYLPNTLVKIGDDIYTVVSSQYQNNKTEVKLTSNLVNPLYTTDTIQRTARPVFAEGETTLVFSTPPILDLPVTIKDNGVTLVSGTDYTLNEDGTVTLSDSKKLTASSNITSTYTIFQNADAGSSVVLSYRFFSSLNEGSVVTASYDFFSRDQFFFDIVYQADLGEALIAKLQEEAAQALNPSSTGFTSSAGGDAANSDSGNETPKLLEFKHRYNDSIAYNIYHWINDRVEGLTNERGSYNGVKPGANSGKVTESVIQDVVNSTSRLFPSGYNETIPKRIPYLDALGKNDDETTTGGVDSSLNFTINMTTQRDTTIPAENTLINQLLALPTSTASVVGSTTISGSVLVYNGTGVQPANNVLSVTIGGVAYTVTFTGTALGTSTTLASFITQINAIISGTPASANTNRLQLSGAGVLIGNGSANSIFGFTNGASSYTRTGSQQYIDWKANLNSQNSQNTTMLANLNQILTYIDVQLQDYWTNDEKQTFDEAITQRAYVEALITATNSRITQNTTDLSMNVNIDSNLTDRRDTKNPARQSDLTAFLNTTSNRVTQIESALTRENLLNKRYAWLKYRTDRGTGSVLSIKRAVDDQIKAAQTAALNKTMSTV